VVILSTIYFPIGIIKVQYPWVWISLLLVLMLRGSWDLSVTSLIFMSLPYFHIQIRNSGSFNLDSSIFLSFFVWIFFVDWGFFSYLGDVIQSAKVSRTRISNSNQEYMWRILSMNSIIKEVHVGTLILLGFSCILRGMSIMPLWKFPSNINFFHDFLNPFLVRCTSHPALDSS